ncbi:hypothetical protein HDU86_000007 [Geranomyces michiganensis]|nr:hypothetical protein HDU86_000007 [Geranomyces michiganensis]
MTTSEEIHNQNSTIINAPPAAVRAAFLDFAAYPTWNPFIIRAEAGKKGGLSYKYDDGKPPTPARSPNLAAPDTPLAITASEAEQPKRFYYVFGDNSNHAAQRLEEKETQDKSKLLTYSPSNTVAITDDNPFAPGCLLDLTIRPTATPDSAILQMHGNIITENSPFAFAWRHDALNGWLLRGENRVEFRPLEAGGGGGRCEFAHSQRYTGALANLAGWWYGDRIASGFKAMGLALKAKVENNAGGNAGNSVIKF